MEQIQAPCSQLMAEPPCFALPGLQLAGCSLGPSGAVRMVHPSSRREWEACVRHHFAAIHSLMLSQMLLPSTAGTAERIQPDGWATGFQHQHREKSAASVLGFEPWHFRSKHPAGQLWGWGQPDH